MRLNKCEKLHLWQKKKFWNHYISLFKNMLGLEKMFRWKERSGMRRIWHAYTESGLIWTKR